jgi:hypothetical protein
MSSRGLSMNRYGLPPPPPDDLPPPPPDGLPPPPPDGLPPPPPDDLPPPPPRANSLARRFNIAPSYWAVTCLLPTRRRWVTRLAYPRRPFDLKDYLAAAKTARITESLESRSRLKAKASLAGQSVWVATQFFNFARDTLVHTGLVCCLLTRRIRFRRIPAPARVAQH